MLSHAPHATRLGTHLHVRKRDAIEAFPGAYTPGGLLQCAYITHLRSSRHVCRRRKRIHMVDSNECVIEYSNKVHLPHIRVSNRPLQDLADVVKPEASGSVPRHNDRRSTAGEISKKQGLSTIKGSPIRIHYYPVRYLRRKPSASKVWSTKK